MTTLNKNITNALTAANRTVEQAQAMSLTELLLIKGIKIAYAKAIQALPKPAPVYKDIVAIREHLLNSAEVSRQLTKLDTYKHSTEYTSTAIVTRDFLANDHYDKQLQAYLDDMVEDEIHNHIATISYRMPSYTLSTPVIYWRENAKIALAATIMFTYIELFGSKITTKGRWNNGVKSFKDTYRVGNPDKLKAIKNTLTGLGFESGLAPMAGKIKGKGGIIGKKPPRHMTKLCKNIAEGKHGIVTDFVREELLNYLMESKEMVSIKEGKFLLTQREIKAIAEGKKPKSRLTPVQRKVLIAERVEETVARYNRELDALYTLQEGQVRHNLPIYHSVHFEYRGRMNYDNTSMLLNPQSKIGKYMWESFNARVLGELDYKWICFSIVGANTRINPADAIELFELEEESLIADYLDETDYLELTYRKRVLQALSDYRTGTPNKTYIHKDYTNGGAIHFTSGLTREPKAMGAVNLLDVDHVNDPHTKLMLAFNKHTGLNATRKDIKDAVSQGITAGISPKSAIANIVDFFKETHNQDVTISEDEYKEIVEDVYGKTGSLFHEYNAWGNDLIDNEHSVLYFKTKDNFPAMSIAYIKAQQVKVYYVSTKESDNGNLATTTVIRNMPYLAILSNGRPEPVLVGPFAQAKKSGFLANVTHGNTDAVAIRAIAAAVHSIGASALYIHDNVVAAPMVQELVIKTAQTDILDNFQRLPFVEAAEQAAEGRKRFPREKFVLSERTSFNIGANFMQA